MGYHASAGIRPSVCSSMAWIASGMVTRLACRSFGGIRPTSDTGWKFTPRTVSRFAAAKRMMSPSWSSLDPPMTVGTSTTPMSVSR